MSEELVVLNRHDLEQMLAEVVRRSQRRWYTVAEAAEYARMSEDSIRRLIAANKLVSHKPRNKVLIESTALDACIRGS